jgi:ribosomal protein S18 acetylase RimI-like enzyme
MGSSDVGTGIGAVTMRSTEEAAGGFPAGREVRRVVAEDVPALSRSLARAFYDDPISVYLFPADRSRLRRLERYFRFQLRTVFLKNGEGWTTGDLASASLWIPPRDSHRPPSIGEGLAQLPAIFILGRSLSRAISLIQLLEQHHPKHRHYYLATIGTDPDRQGTGLGSAVMHDVLGRCDEEGIPAYLESSKEANLAFYNRHGFEVTGRSVIPGSAVRLWFMWREPQPRPGRSVGSGPEERA